VRDTYFHTRSHAIVERFSWWWNPNKSYACILASLAQYKNATMGGCLLEWRITWFVQEISCSLTTLVHLFNPLILLSLSKRSKRFYLQLKLSQGLKLVKLYNKPRKLLKHCGRLCGTYWKQESYQSLRGLIQCSVKQCCLLSIPLVEMLLSCSQLSNISVYLKHKWFNY